MINNYFYDGQLRRYLLQFVSIFHGLQVETGIGECGVAERIPVTTVVGNKDRVVAALMSGNTQNRKFSTPTMSAYLSSLDLAPERRRNPGMLDQRVTLPTGGVFPDDLTSVKRAFPIAYNATFELTIYASNTQQMHQILEQILVLFNPALQIQVSDGEFDWTCLTSVELVGISNDENYPSGQDKRLSMWTLTFLVPIWLSIPMGIRDDLVRRVIIQLGDLGKISVNEVDDEGHLIPFGEPLGTIDFDTRTSPPRDSTVDRYEPPAVGPNLGSTSDVDYPKT